jgi:hypothetical protein
VRALIAFDGSHGTVDNVTARNLTCGIKVDASAGEVTGANTFPDLPGNEANICDNRP